MKALSELHLSQEQILTDSESLKHYGKDWTRYYPPNPSAILFPKNAEEVVQIVQWARKNKIALVPSGGRTGLSGGAMASHHEVVVSFEKMNKILHFNPLDATVTVQAGVVTEDLQNFAKEQGLYYPVDFASRGSSMIGGNIATNAGGIKVLRYGLTRNWVAGLEVVTGSGEKLQLNHGLIKNATGYDLRHLFIGSEGTLGFITEATIRLTKPPAPLHLFLLGVPNLASVMNVFRNFRDKTDLMAFELFTQKALKHVLTHATDLKKPLDSESPIYLLVEVEASHENALEKALAVFEEGLEQGTISDGVLAQNEQQSREFWRMREDISEALAKYTPYKNDISVTIQHVPEFMESIDQVFNSKYPDLEVIWFGHIGDGNLHISILKPQEMDMSDFVKRCQSVDQALYSTIQRLKGSVSAEHGVGLTKKPFLNYTRSSSEILLMKELKSIFDPDNIINPGKLIDK